jgi:hypothetical protein
MRRPDILTEVIKEHSMLSLLSLFRSEESATRTVNKRQKIENKRQQTDGREERQQQRTKSDVC